MQMRRVRKHSRVRPQVRILPERRAAARTNRTIDSTGVSPPVSPTRRIVPFLFAAAMVAAPFIALLYDINAGLAVVTLALLATAYAAYDASQAAEPEMARRLMALAAINGVLGLMAAALLLVRVGGLV